MTQTPPLHPLERERLQHESTLVATVSTADEFHDDVRSAIAALEDDDALDAPPTIGFETYNDLLSTFTPHTLALIEAIRREKPASINATARVVDRDVKNVHEELGRLARLGVVYFEREGRCKRPVVWFDELVIEVVVVGAGGDENHRGTEVEA